MRKPLLCIGMLVVLVYACNQQMDKTRNGLLNPSALPSQLFSVNIAQDTVLTTRNGARISIPAGALSASGTTTVQLEVKEAYTIADIVRAGLTTKSDGELLSSGGMIYINATGGNTVRISKALTVSVPSPHIDSNMQLFKGVEQAGGSINWTKPESLERSAQYDTLARGRALFTENCARCHDLGRHLTGPDLAHIRRRMYEGGESTALYLAFTRNSAEVLDKHDPYFSCLFDMYNRTPMPSFPHLSDEDLKNIYDYIENESNVRRLPVPDNRIMECINSCQEYANAWYRLYERRKLLIRENGSRVEVDLGVDTTLFNPDTERPVQEEEPEMVRPPYAPAVYYQFKVDAFGWYNVDMLLKNLPGMEETELMVRIVGTYRSTVDVFLVIPSLRLFDRGGLLKGHEDTYGFYTTNGKIPLPIGAEAFIIAVTEEKDSIMFGLTAFTISRSQQLELSLATAEKEAFNKAIGALRFDGVTMTASDTKNASAIRQVDKELKDIELLRPKDCPCSCEQLLLRQGKVAPLQDSSLGFTR